MVVVHALEMQIFHRSSKSNYLGLFTLEASWWIAWLDAMSKILVLGCSLLEQQKWHPATGVKNAVSPWVFEQSAVAICYSVKHKAVQQVYCLGLEVLPAWVNTKHLKEDFKVCSSLVSRYSGYDIRKWRDNLNIWYTVKESKCWTVLKSVLFPCLSFS